MTFLVCGEALYDVFVGDATPFGFSLDARIGGSAFNAAVGIARLGRPAGLLTGMATDPLGDRLTAELQREGVAISFLSRNDRRTTLALVALGADGGARYSFYGEGAADRFVETDDLPDPSDGLQGLLFGCLSMINEPTGSSFLTLAQRASGLGANRPLITLDPNVRPTVEPDMARWRDRVAEFAAVADIIKISDEDFALLYPDDVPETKAAEWRRGGVSLVVLTRGGDGSVAWGAFGAISVPAPKTDVIDTVGAGDTFLAGLITALDEAGNATPAGVGNLDRASAEGALRFAAAASAITCSRRGADLPRRADLVQYPKMD